MNDEHDSQRLLADAVFGATPGGVPGDGRRHDMVWFVGAAHRDLARTLDNARAQTGRLVLVSTTARPDSGLPPFEIAADLAASAIHRLAEDPTREELTARYREGLRFLDPALVGDGSARPSALEAHAVTYAIVRRISRESLQSAIKIDLAALFLLHALRKLAAGRGITLVVPGLDVADRPSLRVLNRLMWLAEPSDRFRLVGLCHAPPPDTPVDPQPSTVGGSLTGDAPTSSTLTAVDRLRRYRHRLLDRLRLEWQPTVHQLGPAAVVVPRLPVGLAPGAGEQALTAVAESLVEHNYDRAYLLAEAALATAPAPDVRADLLRLVGLCDANVGEVDLGLASLEDALAAAQRADLRAHLCYLQGLLITKRRYELDLADSKYVQGLAELDRPGPAEDAMFERAWLLNGRALVSALRARSLEPQQRSEVLHDVLRQEIAAFDLATKGTEPRHVYLRHNLLANTAFVLEMLGRFDDAIIFWHRAFGQYLGQSAKAGGFEPIYRYRVGLLEWKAGREDALHSLGEALRTASERDDRFQAERIRYAVAYVHLDRGLLGSAVEHFRAGLGQAWSLRDPLACVQHATGLCAAARQLHRPSLARAVERWLELTGHPSLRDLGEVFAGTVAIPSPKLPAYIPGIDLEPTPEINLNVYLAGASLERGTRAQAGTVQAVGT